MSAYPNLFEVLDDNGDVIAQRIDRQSKVIIKEVPVAKKKDAPKKEEKKPEPVEKATDGFEVINRPPRQPKAEKSSPVTPTSGRGGRGRGRGGDRPPRAEGDQARRQDGDRPPRSDRPRGDRPPRQEGEQRDVDRPPRRERAPRQDGDVERPPRQEGDHPRREYRGNNPRDNNRPPRQDGDHPRPPRENRAPRDNTGEENPRPYRERREFNENREGNVDESGERREDRPYRGRGGGRGRGRGNYGNRPAEPHNDLAEGAPIEIDAQPQRYHSRGRREDVLTDEKGFVQAKHRAYDRRSATGRTGDDVKRHGRGAGNWGSVGEENSEAAYAEAAAFENAVDNNEAAPVEAEAPYVAEPAKKEPEEDNTRTLKEYREAIEKERAIHELPAPRQAGENSNDPAWKNFKVLHKNTENIKLSIHAPTKEKKKPVEAAPSKPKNRAAKVPVEQVFKIKAEPRQDRRRDQNDKKPDFYPKHQKASPAAAPAAPAPKNSKEDFPALVAVKN